MVSRGRLTVVVRGKSSLGGERALTYDGSGNWCGPVLVYAVSQWLSGKNFGFFTKREPGFVSCAAVTNIS